MRHSAAYRTRLQPVAESSHEKKRTKATHRVLAITTHGRGEWIVEVATKRINKVARPFLTGLVRWGAEDVEFVGSTPDNQAVEFRRQHRRKCPGVRCQLVKPIPPETSHGRIRNGDTAEQGEDHSEERVEEDSDLDGWRQRRDKLTNRHTEEFQEDDNQQLEASPVQASSTLPKVHGVHHQNPVHDCAQERVWKLANELSDGKDVWGVNPTRCFSDEGDCEQWFWYTIYASYRCAYVCWI